MDMYTQKPSEKCYSRFKNVDPLDPSHPIQKKCKFEISRKPSNWRATRSILKYLQIWASRQRQLSNLRNHNSVCPTIQGQKDNVWGLNSFEAQRYENRGWKVEVFDFIYTSNGVPGPQMTYTSVVPSVVPMVPFSLKWWPFRLKCALKCLKKSSKNHADLRWSSLIIGKASWFGELGPNLARSRSPFVHIKIAGIYGWVFTPLCHW